MTNGYALRVALGALAGLALGGLGAVLLPPLLVPDPAAVAPQLTPVTDLDALAAPAPPAPAAAGPAAPAAEDPDAPPPGPSFDTVRVEPDGSGLVAGRAQPGAEVEVLADAEVVARATADADGRFVTFLALAPSPEPRALSLRDARGGLSPETVILAPTADPVAPEAVAEAAAPAADAGPASGPAVDAGPSVEPAAAPSSEPADPAVAAAPATEAADPGPDAEPAAPELAVAALDSAAPPAGPAAAAPAPADLAATPAAAPVPDVPSAAPAPADLAATPSAPPAPDVTAAAPPDLAAAGPAATVPAALPARPGEEPAAPAEPSAPATAEPAPQAPAPAEDPAPAVVTAVPPPAAPALPAAPGQAAVLLSDAQGVRVLQPPLPAGAAPELLATVALDAISYDGAGEVRLQGRGTPGDAVRLYLDNRPAAEAAVAPDGTWAASLAGADPGVYTLRLDQLDAEGTVVSRIETPFQRERRDDISAALQEAERLGGASAPALRIVQPGNTLWAIARDRYGEPTMYVRVFEANRDRIRNPDLIYPGQVFVLPEPATP